MNEHESFSDSIYEQQTYLAESGYVPSLSRRKLYGPEQAKLSTLEDELMDSPPRSNTRRYDRGIGSISKSDQLEAGIGANICPTKRRCSQYPRLIFSVQRFW